MAARRSVERERLRMPTDWEMKPGLRVVSARPHYEGLRGVFVGRTGGWCIVRFFPFGKPVDELHHKVELRVMCGLGDLGDLDDSNGHGTDKEGTAL